MSIRNEELLELLLRCVRPQRFQQNLNKPSVVWGQGTNLQVRRRVDDRLSHSDTVATIWTQLREEHVAWHSTIRLSQAVPSERFCQIKDEFLETPSLTKFFQRDIASTPRTTQEASYVLTFNPFISTSGGMRSGCSCSEGTLAQSTVILFRIACVYPSTRGNWISYLLDSARRGRDGV